MALGIRFGRNTPASSHYRIYSLTERLVRDFEKKFGSRNCSDLLGCDISTREGQAAFYEKELGKTLCRDITEATTALVMEVIAKRGEIRHPLIEPEST